MWLVTLHPQSESGERQRLALTLLSPFSAIRVPGPRIDAAQIYGDCQDVCFHGECKFYLVHSQDQPRGQLETELAFMPPSPAWLEGRK